MNINKNRTQNRIILKKHCKVVNKHVIKHCNNKIY
ncbi:MAG TPA: 50S ribosomal protein L33 [Clostridia bacterium]|nr:50S ribosomal protein L33 [Clostridia bacterium]